MENETVTTESLAPSKSKRRTRRGRGEGSVYQRLDGLWCAITPKETGKRKSLYGKTKAEVLKKLREYRPGAGDATRLTVKEYLASWLDGPARNKVEASTLDRYRMIFNGQVYPHLGGLLLVKLAPYHVQELYAALERAGESARSRELAGTVLGTALRHAVRLKLIPHNPVSDIPKPRPVKREMRVWSAGQVKSFLKTAATDRLHALYVLAVSTGMRSGELFGLQWGDVDLEAGSLSVNRTLEELHGQFRLKEPKTAKSRRRIDLPKMAVDALHDHRRRMLAEGNAGAVQVFCDTAGGYLRQSNVHRRSMAPLMVAAELPRIRFHDLRHTAATLLLLAGENPKVVSERLGHASIEITLNVYSHVLPTMQKEAARKIDAMLA